MSDNHIFTPRSSIVFREESDGGFVFDPDSGDVLALNSLGAYVWKLCDGKHKQEEIIKLIAEHYPDIPDSKIREDLPRSTSFELRRLRRAIVGSRRASTVNVDAAEEHERRHQQDQRCRSCRDFHRQPGR